MKVSEGKESYLNSMSISFLFPTNRGQELYPSYFPLGEVDPKTY